MQLYIMRHAVAELRETWGQPDIGRPLTAKGRTRMRLAARGLRAAGARFDLIASSPLVRAVETAEIIAREFKYPVPIEICPALAPGLEPEPLFRFLVEFPEAERVLLVGHEPDLGNLVLSLIGGAHSDRFPMRKGAVCRVDIERVPPPGLGTLVWALTPALMRQMAD